jgi:hypothetical protein
MRAAAVATGVAAPVLTLAASSDYEDYYGNYNYSDTAELSDTAAAALGIGFMIFALIMFALSLVSLIFTVVMIVDAAKRNFDQKVMWIILMLFFGLFAAVPYYFIVKRKNLTSANPVAPAMPAAEVKPETPASTPEQK